MQDRTPTRLDRPYARFQAEEMILRDFLAADRTVLANERTLLAYIRTALACAITGVSLIHFLDGLAWDVAGVVLVLAGFATVILGGARYWQVRRRVAVLSEAPSDASLRAVLQARKDENV